MKKNTYVSLGVLIVFLLVFGLLLSHASMRARFLAPRLQSVRAEQTLRIGYLPIADHLPLMVADQGKMFQGVHVQAVRFSDWPTLVEALKAGKIDGAHMINTLAIKMVSQGFPAQAVALSHRGGLALTVKNAVMKPENLKGSIVAVPTHFSPHYMDFFHYMEEHKIDIRKDLTTIDMAPPDMVPALASKSIDGLVVSEPFPSLAVSKNVGKILALWNEMQVPGTNGLDCVVVFRKDVITANADLVQNYVTSIVKAGMFIEQHRLMAATLASPLMNNLPSQVIMSSIDGSRDRVSYDNLLIQPSEFIIFQDYMIHVGILDKPIDLKSFLNDSFVTKAYQK